MWRFTRSNGIAEGFHGKRETIRRQAYGFPSPGTHPRFVVIPVGGLAATDKREDFMVRDWSGAGPAPTNGVEPRRAGWWARQDSNL
jgi:hypothetical protein